MVICNFSLVQHRQPQYPRVVTLVLVWSAQANQINASTSRSSVLQPLHIEKLLERHYVIDWRATQLPDSTVLPNNQLARNTLELYQCAMSEEEIRYRSSHTNLFSPDPRGTL